MVVGRPAGRSQPRATELAANARWCYFGVLSIKIMENCINLLRVSSRLYLAVQGVVILLAIVLENLKNRSL